MCAAVAGLVLIAPSSARASGGSGEDLFTAGMVTLSVSYGLSVIGAAVGVAFNGSDEPVCTDSAAWGFLPLVGALITGVTYPNYQKIDAAGSTAACADYTAAVLSVGVVDSVAQITGASLAIAGLAMGSGGRGRGGLTVEPMTVVGGAGVQLIWRGM